MSRRYQTPLEATWFLHRRGYALFMAREATSLFVAVPEFFEGRREGS